jgi:hypothetical protein
MLELRDYFLAWISYQRMSLGIRHELLFVQPQPQPLSTVCTTYSLYFCFSGMIYMRILYDVLCISPCSLHETFPS